MKIEVHPAHTSSYYLMDDTAETQITSHGVFHKVQYLCMVDLFGVLHREWQSVGYYYTRATAERALAVLEGAKKSGAEKGYLPREGSQMYGDYILKSGGTLKKYVEMLEVSLEEAERYRQKIIDDYTAEYEERRKNEK